MSPWLRLPTIRLLPAPWGGARSQPRVPVWCSGEQREWGQEAWFGLSFMACIFFIYNWQLWFKGESIFESKEQSLLTVLGMFSQGVRFKWILGSGVLSPLLFPFHKHLTAAITVGIILLPGRRLFPSGYFSVPLCPSCSGGLWSQVGSSSAGRVSLSSVLHPPSNWGPQLMQTGRRERIKNTTFKGFFFLFFPKTWKQNQKAVPVSQHTAVRVIWAAVGSLPHMAAAHFMGRKGVEKTLKQLHFLQSISALYRKLSILEATEKKWGDI